MLGKKKCLWMLLGLIGAEMILTAFIVWLFDPFFQYHGPLPGLDAVFNDRDNQMPGSVRNLSYDSVLMGSSVVENCDSSFLDRQYECNTLKVVRASGSVADLLYYLEMAQEKHELKNVFWCLDLTALDATWVNRLWRDDAPRYLHTETVLDDGTYLWNKDVLLQTIPLMLAYEMTGRNTGGRAYDWSDGKIFSAQQAMRAYSRPDERLEPRDFTPQKENIRHNLELLSRQIREHPDITYRFFFPPFSMNWWDCAYVNGELEEKFYILEKTFPVLLSFDNVEVYFFQDDQEVICNLDNYMDLVHYSPEINQWMLDRLVSGDGRVTTDNWQEKVEGMRDLAEKISSELIYRYYPE